MPLLAQRYQCALKLEGTAYTKESLGNSDVAYLASKPTMQKTIAVFKRPRNGRLGQEKAATGARMAVFTLVFELAGKGSSGTPVYADLWQCCGMSKSSQTYTATSDTSTWKTATVAINLDGTIHTIYGAMGNAVINAPEASSAVPTVTFTLTGILEADADAAAWTNATPVLPPTSKGGTFTMDAYSPLIGTFSVDLGNTVVMRPDHTHTSGYAGAYITAQDSTLSVDPEMAAVATFDPWDKILDAAEIDVQYILDGGSNNTITIDIAKAQPINAPDAERNGILINQLSMQVNEQALVITYS